MAWGPCTVYLNKNQDPKMNEPSRNFAVGNQNRAAWNQLARHGQRFTRAATDEEFRDPLAVLDASGWLSPGIQGRRTLCLAAGGGRQAPLYAAAGADVTVVDISPAQLELDRVVAQERNLVIRTVETSMHDLSMFQTGEFEIIIHPVSTCYLPELSTVYQQIARVTRAGGVYISQHKQPVSLQSATEAQPSGYLIEQPYYERNKTPLPPVQGSLHREEGTLEFVHRWEELLGSMCRASFVIEDLVEPRHADESAAPGTFAHRSTFVPPYVRVKARRRTADKVASLVLR